MTNMRRSAPHCGRPRPKRSGRQQSLRRGSSRLPAGGAARRCSAAGRRLTLPGARRRWPIARPGGQHPAPVACRLRRAAPFAPHDRRAGVPGDARRWPMTGFPKFMGTDRQAGRATRGCNPACFAALVRQRRRGSRLLGADDRGAGRAQGALDHQPICAQGRRGAARRGRRGRGPHRRADGRTSARGRCSGAVARCWVAHSLGAARAKGRKEDGTRSPSRSPVECHAEARVPKANPSGPVEFTDKALADIAAVLPTETPPERVALLSELLRFWSVEELHEHISRES